MTVTSSSFLKALYPVVVLPCMGLHPTPLGALPGQAPPRGWPLPPGSPPYSHASLGSRPNSLRLYAPQPRLPLFCFAVPCNLPRPQSSRGPGRDEQLLRGPA